MLLHEPVSDYRIDFLDGFAAYCKAIISCIKAMITLKDATLFRHSVLIEIKFKICSANGAGNHYGRAYSTVTLFARLRG